LEFVPREFSNGLSEGFFLIGILKANPKGMADVLTLTSHRISVRVMRLGTKYFRDESFDHIGLEGF
jgi:hypothetical protein